MGNCIFCKDEPKDELKIIVEDLKIIVKDLQNIKIKIETQTQIQTEIKIETETEIEYKDDCETSVALKFPHGITGIIFKDDIKECLDINQWISSLYKSTQWKEWIVYNDETSHIGNKSHSKGHCKGILAWNDTEISWLVHSVPNFPEIFTGNDISKIEPSELIYGQSFFYIKRKCDSSFLEKVISQLYNMDPHIYIKQNNINPPKKEYKIIELQFSNKIIHLSKSPKCEIDIYSEYITKKDLSNWYVETWKRGLPIKTICSNLIEIENISFKNVNYKESQDHSKWAACNSYYFIGDLNRMTSQYKRGGGGFLVENDIISKALLSLIKK
jgi:hypothetical protein